MPKRAMSPSPSTSLHGGGTAAHDRDAVPGLLTDAGPDRHVSDFAAAIEYLQGLDFVDERLGMTGFCFGGGITWHAATALPFLKAGSVYGPAPDLDQVPNINAAVLGVYAEQDERITGAPRRCGARQQDAIRSTSIPASTTPSTTTRAAL